VLALDVSGTDSVFSDAYYDTSFFLGQHYAASLDTHQDPYDS